MRGCGLRRHKGPARLLYPDCGKFRTFVRICQVCVSLFSIRYRKRGLTERAYSYII